MHKFRDVVSSHFGLFLFGSFLVGLVLPGGELVPKYVVPIILASIIFIACSKITMEDIQQIEIKKSLGFFIFRFLIVPILVYYVSAVFVPDYKYSLLLVSLVPCGVTLPAVTSIMGGNPALALGMLTLTSLTAPFVIPAAFGLLSDMTVELDLFGMFQTLVLMVFVPIILYFGVARKIEPVKEVMRENASMVSVIFICVIILIIISGKREFFYLNPLVALQSTIIGLIAFAIFYAIGWYSFYGGDLIKKLSFGLIGGNVNSSLAVSLGYLYFPEEQILQLVMFYIAWLSALSFFQFRVHMIERKHKSLA